MSAHPAQQTNDDPDTRGHSARRGAHDHLAPALSVAARLRYVAAALGTITVGLLVHRGALPLGAATRDITGDALWAVMMVWWISVLVPQMEWRWRATVALAVCWLVEGSQLLHTPALDAFRATTIGHLLLGSGFDSRDLLAYALGSVLTMLPDRTVRGGGWAGSGR